MTTKATRNEYVYTNSNSGHHHNYIATPILNFLGFLSPPQNIKLCILDLGCGNGSLSNIIANAGYTVTGIEPSASGIQQAQSQYPNCRFIEASIYDLPYDELENQFDAVVSAEVIEHLLYPKELARAAQRCLKPGGHLVITTPYHGYLKNLVLSLFGAMDKHFTVLWDGGHIKFFSVKTLTALLKEEGFIEIKFKFTGRLPFLWKSMICSCRLP